MPPRSKTNKTYFYSHLQKFNAYFSFYRLEKLKISISDEDIKTLDKRVLLLDLAEVISDFSYRPSAESWALSMTMESLVVSGLKNKKTTPTIVNSIQAKS